MLILFEILFLSFCEGKLTAGKKGGGQSDPDSKVSRYRDDTSKSFSDEVVKALRIIRYWYNN